MKTSHRWLLELTHLPTTSGHEDRVIAWVRVWAARRRDIRITADRAGNLLLTIKGRRRRDPLIATAHMDHPGFVIESIEGRTVTARFMGGVHAQYFEGASVDFFDAAGEGVVATVASMADQIVTTEAKQSTRTLAPGDIGRWRFTPRSLGIRNDILRAPACDDLAGVAAALTALDRARSDPRAHHFGVLLTRAEEEGLLGAIAACELGTIPDGSRLLSIETSRAFPDSPIGAGPIVRVGDKSSVFDASLSNGVTQAVRASGLVHQRKLMSGGSCEATAFGAYGHVATGLCLALGNYHNMVDIDGVLAGTTPAKVAPEEISLADFDGLVALMRSVAVGLDDADQLVDRLARNFDERKSLLGL